MKKINILFLFTFLSGFVNSQEIRYILKERVLNNGEKTSDTIWQVQKISTRIDEENKVINDTTWVKLGKKAIVQPLSHDSKPTIYSNVVKTNNVFSKGRGLIGILGKSSVSIGLGVDAIKLGYFISDNQVLGGGGQISFGENAGVNLNAFYRTYFGNNVNGKIWGEFSSDLISIQSQSSFGIGLGVGYTSVLNNYSAFDFGLKYQKLGKFNGEMFLNFGLTFFIGN